MYLVEDKSYSWVRTFRELKGGDIVQNKGARASLVTQGVFIVDHLPTGRFIIGTSRTVSAEVDKNIDALIRGTHPNRMLQKQYNHGPDLRLIEIPARSAKEAKQIEAKIRKSNTTDYCLLN